MTSLPPMNLLEAVWKGKVERSDEVMLTFVDIARSGAIEEAHRSYSDLWRNGSAICNALQDAGMKAGEAFALLMHNHPEFVDSMVGSSMAGTVYVPIDPRTAGPKLEFMLGFADCRGAVVADYALDSLLELVDRLPQLEWIWVLGAGPVPQHPRVRISAMDDILSEPGDEQTLRDVDPTEPMQMIFTSGTTGDPKAIRAPHARFAFGASAGAAFGLRDGDRPYTGLPLSHANAQMITLGNALTMQLPCVISRRFTKSRLWELLSTYNCTVFNLLGGMTTAIFAEPEGAHDRSHHVRYVISAGMPAGMWQEFGERFGVEILEFYGTAEGGMLLNPPGGPIGSVGKAIPGSMCAILDDDGMAVERGSLGELCFRNADHTVSPVNYHKNKAASEDKTRGGWFHSGDVGWEDDNGFFYFAHRMGTAIRRNGEFISPGEVEKIIAEDPGVADVFVYGIATADNSPGEREVVAAVVPRDDHFIADAVFARCAQHLSVNCRPKFLQILDIIPKTASEKPQERILLELIKNGHSHIVGEAGETRIKLGEKL